MEAEKMGGEEFSHDSMEELLNQKAADVKDAQKPQGLLSNLTAPPHPQVQSRKIKVFLYSIGGCMVLGFYLYYADISLVRMVRRALFAPQDRELLAENSRIPFSSKGRPKSRRSIFSF